MKLYIIFSTMKTGSTTLFNRISHSVIDPVLHTHNMEVASVKNMSANLESRLGCGNNLRGEKSVFENEEVYRIIGEITKLFQVGDDIYIITAVRDPLSQKISHIMHALNLYNIFDEQLYGCKLGDPKKYLYEYLGRLLLERPSNRNIYFEYVYKEKSLVPTEFILRSWEPRKKRKCDYNFSLKYIIKKILGEKETILDKASLRDTGCFVLRRANNVNYNVMIVKTEQIDNLEGPLSNFIGHKIKYREHHRDKYGAKTMYISKDDIHTVIKKIKEYARQDPHILELYSDDIVRELGYSIPQ